MLQNSATTGHLIRAYFAKMGFFLKIPGILQMIFVKV